MLPAGSRLSALHMENFWVNRAKRVLSALWLLGTIVITGRGDSGTNRFGFTGPEIFPIDNQIGHLRAADLDGDGLQDLIVVNNSRSKINLLYNQTGKTNADQYLKRSSKREMNELPPDARFRMESKENGVGFFATTATDLYLNVGATGKSLCWVRT